MLKIVGIEPENFCPPDRHPAIGVANPNLRAAWPRPPRHKSKVGSVWKRITGHSGVPVFTRTSAFKFAATAQEVLDRLVECAAEVEVVFDFKRAKAALGECPDLVEIAVKVFADKPKARLLDSEGIAFFRLRRDFVRNICLKVNAA